MSNAHGTLRSWLFPRAQRPERVRLELTPLEDRTVPAMLHLVSEPTATVSDPNHGAVSLQPTYFFWGFGSPILSGYLINASAGTTEIGSNSYSIQGPLVLEVQPASPSEHVGDLVSLHIDWRSDVSILNYVNTPGGGVDLRDTPSHIADAYLMADGGGVHSIIHKSRTATGSVPGEHDEPTTYFNGTVAIGSTIQINHTLTGLATTDASGSSLAWTDLYYNFSVGAVPSGLDFAATSLARSSTKNGVDLTYTLTGAPNGGLQSKPKVAFYWATGTTFESRLPGPAAYTADLKKVNGTYTLFAPGFRSAPKGATHFIAVLDSAKKVDEINEGNNVAALEYKPDIVVKSVRWTPSKGGMGITYDLTGRSLTADETTNAKVAVYWGQNDTPIAEPIFTTVLNGKMGTGKKIQVPGSELTDAPDEATQLVVVIDSDHAIDESNEDNNASSLQDVTVTYKDDARQLLTPYTIEIIKEALRYAGQKSGQVNSTFRTPREQAEAMYANILATSVVEQKDLYAAAGGKVIQAYQDELSAYKKAKKRDPNTLVPDYVGIMEAKIYEIGFNADGTSKVSKHCYRPEDFANYMLYQALDLSYSLMTNKQLFHEAITFDPRIEKVLDPFTTPKDPAFHIEVPQ